jgi:opacity protein-like surface antigen
MKCLRKLKVVMSVAALTFLSVSALAQEETTTRTSVTGESRAPDRFVRRIMVEGSLANAGYQGDTEGRYSKPNGYTAGILADLIGSDKMVLETGVLYRQFGTDYASGIGPNTFTANYISVPLAAKYYFRDQEETSFYMKGGVMGSTLISDNRLYETATSQFGARAWETAFLVGLGMKFNLTAATDLLVEADYSRSIDSVFNNYSVYRSDISGALGLAINL